MAVEVGQIVRGTVVHLAPYGALVRLEDGATGLVHISEITQDFVHNVVDHVQQGDTVIVKVLPSRKKGKIELSIRQAQGAEPPPPIAVAEGESQAEGRDQEQTSQTPSAPPPPSQGYARRESRGAFEDKMRDFLDNSSDRLNDVRRQTDSKRGRKSR